MKKLLILALILALSLTACSGPLREVLTTTTGSQTRQTTVSTDYGLGKAADYSSLMTLIMKAQDYITRPVFKTMDRAENAAGAPAEGSSKTGSEDSSISQTNIQVAGVDEADIIKTDGSYLYAVANNRLYIIDAGDPAAMKVMSIQQFANFKQTDTEQIFESPVEIFLDTENQRLTLIINGSINTIYVPPVETGETKPTETDETTVETKPEETAVTETVPLPTAEPGTDPAGPDEPVTQPGDNGSSGSGDSGSSSDGKTTTTAGSVSPDSTLVDDGTAGKIDGDRIWNPYYQSKSYTTTRIYDISDKANPRIVRQFTQEGYYLTSRMITGDIYVVSNQYKYQIYAENAKELKPEDVLPAVTDDVAGGEWDLLPPEKISVVPESDVSNQLIISGIDTLQDSRKPDTVSLIGSSGMVYASAANLYVAAWGMVWDGKENSTLAYTTDIYRFSLSDSMIQESGKASVPGSVINQFSMDEYNGYFRLATTTWASSSDGTENLTSNQLYILDSSLKMAGQVTDLAKGESIQSVRFMGDQAYIVTFRQVDPLFVIDLKNPNAPVVLGQLKIPGFSTYLHPYGENLLLGFGCDVRVDGDNAYTMGMKVSMFDVSDFNNPKEVSTLLLGGRGSYSDILYNHKSLLFSMEKNLIAFPAVLTKLIDGDPLAYTPPVYQGLLVLTVGDGNQLKLRGSVTHFDKLSDPNGSGTLNDVDYNSFYGYDAIYRGAFIGNTLFTFSGRQIRSADLNTLEPAGAVELPGYDDVQNSVYYYGRGIADTKGGPVQVP